MFKLIVSIDALSLFLTSPPLPPATTPTNSVWTTQAGPDGYYEDYLTLEADEDDATDADNGGPATLCVTRQHARNLATGAAARQMHVGVRAPLPG